MRYREQRVGECVSNREKHRRHTVPREIQAGQASPKYLPSGVPLTRAYPWRNVSNERGDSIQLHHCSLISHRKSEGAVSRDSLALNHRPNEKKDVWPIGWIS